MKIEIKQAVTLGNNLKEEFQNALEHCANSIADLKARPPGSARCVQLLGYHAPGDGGGGLFFWDASSTEPDNGGTTIAPALSSMPVPGRWKRLVDGSLSVKWFGARGDGITDDSAAIQTAFNALVSAGGGVLFFPLGRYNCLSPLKFQNTYSSNIIIVIQGQGRGNPDVPGSGSSVIVGNTGGIVVDCSGGSRLAFQDLAIISGMTHPSTLGILFQRTAADPFCDQVSMMRVSIGMATSPSSWSGKGVAGFAPFTLGSIALFNSRGEHHHYVDCSFTADTCVVLDGNSWYDGTVHSPDYAAYSGIGTTLQMTQYDTCLFTAIGYNALHLVAALQVSLLNPYFNVSHERGVAIVAAYSHNLTIRSALLEPGTGTPAKLIDVWAPCRNWDVQLVASAGETFLGIDTTNVGLGGGTYVRNFRASFYGGFAHVLNGPFGQGDVFYSSVTDGSSLNVTATAYGDISSIERHDFDETALTWTPVVAFGGASVGVTYGRQLGTYVRNKNRITAQCEISLTNQGSSSGALTVTGLPSASVSTIAQSGIVVADNMASGFGANPPMALVSAGASAISLYKMVSGAKSAVLNSDCSNTTVLCITVTYEIP